MLLAASMVFVGFFVAPLTVATAAQTTTNVTVQNFAFGPVTITVVIGVNNTVTWTNKDSTTHTVTANDGSFNGNLPSGGTFTQTFTTAGTYTYHCSIHTYMKGTVIVLGAPSSTSTSSTSTSTGGGGIPEFPAQALAVTAVTAIVLISYLVLRRTGRSRLV